ncbi:MAG: hypothetical protein Q7R95_08625 [bacterium]|nr:hypothetical protein [bacterium]
MPKKIKIGFDLDGVILYNPIRIFRPIVSHFNFLKPLLFHENAESFYFPNSQIEKFVWKQLHKTSYKLAPGIEELKNFIKKNEIDAYIITSRYSFLKTDFEYWIQKMNAKSFLKNWFYNAENEQPNAFKSKMIHKLKLDYFVEDNWGVIKKLNGSVKNTKIIWLSNILDKNIAYPYKCFNLKEVIRFFIKIV